MADNKFLPNLSQNLLEILNDEEYCDITIEVGNDPHVKIFRTHMVILNYRSPYLKRILSTNERRNDGTLTHIKLPNILPEIFQVILRYIYTGKLSLAEHDTSDVIKILIAASELNLYELIPHLQSFLIVSKNSWLEQNFCSIYQTSFEDNSFSKLQKFCEDLISNHPEKIFNLPDFTSISEKALISLIQHNHQMTEVQIWEHVLKWGIAQNSELSSDPSNYSNDDFSALKNILQQFIPLIKFTKFAPREFLKKVYPYKKIIPDEINEDLINYYLDHDYVPNRNSEQQTINETKDIDLKNIDSNIITIQHVELISKWIDRLDITDESKNSYEFKLILRGSRDGFTPENFHENCDSRSHTITVIKVEGSEEILGGYNPIEWKDDDNNYVITNDSFIFSFKNNDNIGDYILSRVRDENKAIYYNCDYGPSFGYGDLIIKSNYLFSSSKKNFNHCYCKKYSYENALRETGNEYTIKEYEIFQITKYT